MVWQKLWLLSFESRQFLDQLLENRIPFYLQSPPHAPQLPHSHIHTPYRSWTTLFKKMVCQNGMANFGWTEERGQTFSCHTWWSPLMDIFFIGKQPKLLDFHLFLLFKGWPVVCADSIFANLSWFSKFWKNGFCCSIYLYPITLSYFPVINSLFLSLKFKYYYSFTRCLL